MKRLGIEDLIALNEEILALSRAGVPIGRGLLDMGADMPRKLRAATDTIGARLEQGERLEDVVAAGDTGLPPVYRAVVAAGIESGRLPIALERLSSTLARVAELRRMVTLAAVYPLFISLLGCGLISFVAVPLLRSVRETFQFQGAEIPRWLSILFDIGIGFGPYAIFVGIGIVLIAVVWYVVSHLFLGSRVRFVRLLGWLPGVRRVVHTGRTAAFLETLRLLVSQNVPMDRAIQLAADATGDALLQADANTIATTIRAGGQPTVNSKLYSIPPLVEWLLATPQSKENLVASLNTMVDAYTERTQRTGEVLQAVLPMWFTVMLGGTVTAVYVAFVMIPWATMMSKLAEM